MHLPANVTPLMLLCELTALQPDNVVLFEILFLQRVFMGVGRRGVEGGAGVN